MNLKEIYEIFYPGNEKIYPSVWKEIPKYRTKKDFFEEVIPMELRWINMKLWNNKTRRSRFFADSQKEKTYLSELRKYMFQNPTILARVEDKCYQMLEEQVHPQILKQIFNEIKERKDINMSSVVEKHLNEEQYKTENLGNILAFFIFFAMFPKEINQIYIQYLYQKQKMMNGKDELKNSVRYQFLYEYPPDMEVFRAGEEVTHTWVIKNVGDVIWEGYSFVCICPPEWLREDNQILEIKNRVYPGDLVSLTVRFLAPNAPGHYVLNWKMKDENRGAITYNKVGLGLHFTVIEETCEEVKNSKNDYKIAEENPKIVETQVAGNVYEHTWVIANTGTIMWKNYYCECINGEAFGYLRNELRIPLKSKILPGEQVSAQIEFVTPPLEGNYKLIWKIMDENGKPAFGEGRKLEVVLNLI